MMSVRDISESLTMQAEAAAQALLPDGRRVGLEWYASSSHSPLGYAVSVVLRGRKQGVVLFTGGTSNGKVGGDILNLAQEIYGSKRAGIEWAKNFLGIHDLSPEQSAQARKLAERKQRDREWKEKEERRRKLARVRKVWTESGPIAGTLAEAYLIGRGLTKSEWPPTIRFHPCLEWTAGGVKTDEGWRPGPSYPALVSAVQNADRELTAVWRIYLNEQGEKADLDPCKVGLGYARGGAVRLGPVAESIAVAEGLETSLAVRELLSGAVSVWATLSTSGMTSFEPPSIVRKVNIYPDSDLPRVDPSTGRRTAGPGMRAAMALRDRMVAEGRMAVIVDAPEYTTDYLDIVRTNNAWR